MADPKVDSVTREAAAKLLDTFSAEWNAPLSPNRLRQKGNRLSQEQLKRRPRRSYRIKSRGKKLKDEKKES